MTLGTMTPDRAACDRIRALRAEQSVLRLPVLEIDGSILVVEIPRLSESAFEFLKTMLDRYKPAIVKAPEEVSP